MSVKRQSETATQSDEMIPQGLAAEKDPLPLAPESESTTTHASKEPPIIATVDENEFKLANVEPASPAPQSTPSEKQDSLQTGSPNSRKKVKIGELLIQEGVVTPEQIEQALMVQKTRHPAPPLGEVCVELGFFSPATLNKILSKHHERIPLGEMLVHLGLVNQDQINTALEMQRTTKRRLGTILVEQGHLTTDALVGVLYKQSQIAKQHQEKRQGLAAMSRVSPQEMSAAIAAAREQQQPLGTVLLERFRLSKEEAGQALSMHYKCPFAEFNDSVVISPGLLRGISTKYLRTHFWVPLRSGDHWVEILIDDPQSFSKIQDIKRTFPGKEIRCVVGFREDIAKYINQYISDRAGTRLPRPTSTSTTAPPSPMTPDSHLAPPSFWEGKGDIKPREEVVGPVLDEIEDEALDENDSTVVRLVNQLVTDAVKMGISDIHIEPYGAKKDIIVRFRMDGVCYEHMRVPSEYSRPLVSRIKVLSRLDIAERRKPQDGKFKFRLTDREVELRVATVPTSGGEEDAVLRILASNEPLPLAKLNLTQRNQQELTRLLEQPHGLILCVGPTGSGKTTTLHACLGHINVPGRKIWTAEDPVEITQTGLRQVQVHPKIGVTFATAMRSFLRADPDIIMVGEVRDQETAETCTEASLTGHLVLSTLHTNSAAETITRLLDMGLDPFSFADALQGVIAQRLARTICVNCKERYRPGKEEYDAIMLSYGEEEFTRLAIPYDDRFILYHGKGCETCRGTGYKGRLGLHELLVVSDEIRSLIHSHGTITDIRKVAQAQGMTTLIQDGILKVLQGLTDYTQVKAVAMR
jgi:type II secretory ATPase GspE/PulE/Tfp pilus assembly ATPase PilB-like protein